MACMVAVFSTSKYEQALVGKKEAFVGNAAQGPVSVLTSTPPAQIKRGTRSHTLAKFIAPPRLKSAIEICASTTFPTNASCLRAQVNICSTSGGTITQKRAPGCAAHQSLAVCPAVALRARPQAPSWRPRVATKGAHTSCVVGSGERHRPGETSPEGRWRRCCSILAA
jgi:hypothetical protein